MSISETALNGVLKAIRNGDTSHVKDFFAARPEWQDEDGED